MERILYLIPEYSNFYRYTFHSCKIKQGFRKKALLQELNVNTAWTPQTEERYYFMTGCTVPRFKVREKFIVTIKPEKATSIFINTDNLHKSDDFVRWGGVPLNKEKLLKLVDELDVDKVNENFCMKVRSLCAANAFDIAWLPDIITTNRTYVTVSSKGSSYRTVLGADVFDIPESDKFFYQCPPKLYDVPIYSQECLLKVLNEDNLIIDEIKYNEFQSMLNTKDKANVVLTMELMSNSNFEKSHIYLLLLLKKYGMEFLNSNVADHTNFKSLLAYLGIDRRQIRYKDISLNTLTKSLEKHKHFTRENAMLIAQACVYDTQLPDKTVWKSAYLPTQFI
jgi:hypothetical protein